LKGVKLRIILTIFVLALLFAVVGCNGAADQRQLLSVDFQQNQTLRYKFTSSREIEVDWDPTKSAPKSAKAKVDKSTESVDMVVAYTPLEIDPFGLTIVEATCESIRVKRRAPKGPQASGRDAVESLKGKTFTFTVDPTGKITDYSKLDELVRQIGEKPFRIDSRRGRIKEPDMIGDFIATQWFLWDSVSSIKKPASGVLVGETWQSKLSVPTPMVMRKARDVAYTLDEIRPGKKGRLAVIGSSYSMSDSVPSNWPIPYSGSFQMSGRFGFLKGYKVLDLQGQGRELFNIDAGRTEEYDQQYQMQLEASLPMGIDVHPRLTVKQNLTMKILE
jgi:hypothetical protein